jgi:hypothetical protein
MEVTNIKEVKGCSKCSKNKSANEKDEKTCKTCKKTFNKFVPYLIISMALFGFAIYGIVVFVQNMITLFSK